MAETPLPKRPLIILCSVIFSEPLSYFIIFPFIYFMVKDFNLTEDPKEIGVYVGLIASVFAISGMISGLFWGWVSDNYGRRPVLLLGLLGNAIFTTMFGLSKSFAWAIFTRFCAGLVNANIGVAKSMLSELTDATNEARGFSYFGLVNGIGAVVGPILGGFLCDPATRYPDLFGHISFLHEYPFFLPCFVSSWFTGIAFVFGYFNLDETLKRKKPKPQSSETDSLLGQAEEASEEIQETTSWTSLLNIHVLLAILPNCVIAFIQVSYQELFSLWSVTAPEDGGLHFSPTEIGWAFSYVGVIGMIIQLFIFPPMQRKYGKVACFRFAMLGYFLVFVLSPENSFFARQYEKGTMSYAWIWVMLLSISTLRIFCGKFAFTSSMMLISSAGRQFSALGLINGLAATGAKLMRSMGPTIVGSSWSWSITNGLGYPFDYRFVFYIMAFLSILVFLQTILHRQQLKRLDHFGAPGAAS